MGGGGTDIWRIPPSVGRRVPKCNLGTRIAGAHAGTGENDGDLIKGMAVLLHDFLAIRPESGNGRHPLDRHPSAGLGRDVG